MNPNIGSEPQCRDAVVGLLTALLADAYVLYTKTRNYTLERGRPTVQ